MVEISRLLSDLVRLPSINPMGRPVSGQDYFEHRVTDYLEHFLRGLGVACARQHVAPARDNIVARFTSEGAGRTLLLEAHQDTVPVDNMTIEPFAARIEGGRLYGRGACDVKGGMAAMLAAFARIVRARPPGACNLILACTVDEEHTFLGVQKQVQEGLKADMAVVAEPTSLKIVNAHKGVVRWHVSTQGRACHSSAPDQGENAIYAMARLLECIDTYAAKLAASAADPRLGPPTLSVGRIEGGSSVNTVPDYCRIEVDRRLIPGEEPTQAWEDFRVFLEKETRKQIPFHCSEPWHSAQPLSSRGSEALVRDLGAAIDTVRGTHEVIAVPYSTDAAVIAAAGIPAVVFGPGDIARAHTCDESVPLDEVEQASEILYRLACRIS
jgi:acetylornithine deacetylase/succinyl-diaminopimelate desuccinylase family protein